MAPAPWKHVLLLFYLCSTLYPPCSPFPPAMVVPFYLLSSKRTLRRSPVKDFTRGKCLAELHRSPSSFSLSFSVFLFFSPLSFSLFLCPSRALTTCILAKKYTHSKCITCCPFPTPLALVVARCCRPLIDPTCVLSFYTARGEPPLYLVGDGRCPHAARDGSVHEFHARASALGVRALRECPRAVCALPSDLEAAGRHLRQQDQETLPSKLRAALRSFPLRKLHPPLFAHMNKYLYPHIYIRICTNIYII